MPGWRLCLCNWELSWVCTVGDCGLVQHLVQCPLTVSRPCVWGGRWHPEGLLSFQLEFSFQLRRPLRDHLSELLNVLYPCRSALSCSCSPAPRAVSLSLLCTSPPWVGGCCYLTGSLWWGQAYCLLSSYSHGLRSSLMTAYDCLVVGLRFLPLSRDKRPPAGFPCRTLCPNPLLFFMRRGIALPFFLQASAEMWLDPGCQRAAHPSYSSRQALFVLISWNPLIHFLFSWVLKDREFADSVFTAQDFYSLGDKVTGYSGALFLSSSNHQPPPEHLCRWGSPLQPSAPAVTTCREEPCECLGPWPCIWNPSFCKLPLHLSLDFNISL